MGYREDVVHYIVNVAPPKQKAYFGIIVKTQADGTTLKK